MSDKFRVLLLDISDRLTTNELSRLKYACSGIIPPGKAEKINYIHEFFQELERLEYLGSDNREYLASLFHEIGRTDLRNKLLGIRAEARQPRMSLRQQDPSVRAFDGIHVTEDLTAGLVEDISTDWKMIGRYLRVKEAVLRRIDDENRRVVNKTAEMFQAWMKGNPTDATIPVLITALDKASRRDLAEKVKEWAQTHMRMAAREHDVQPLSRPVQATGQPLLNMQKLDPAPHVYGKTGRQLPIEHEPNTLPTPAPETAQPEEHVHDGGHRVQPAIPPGPRAVSAAQLETTAPGNRCCEESPAVIPPGPRVVNAAQLETTPPGNRCCGESPAAIPPGPRVVNAAQLETTPPGDRCCEESPAVQPDEVPDGDDDTVTDAFRAPVEVSEMSSISHAPVLEERQDPARYQAEKSLGCGSFGEVFRVKSAQDDTFQAVKLINLHRKDRSIQEKCTEVAQEVKQLATLKSRFLVQYLHTEEGENTLAVVTLYMAGGSIRDWIRQNGKLAEPRVRVFTWQILRGLEFLHSKQIIHQRLRGANVMLDESRNTVKLADYGIYPVLVKLRESIGGYQLSSDDVHWSSPEMLLGEDVTSKTDIWSLGCTVCEMLTGYAPLANKGLNPWAVMNRYCSLKVHTPHECTSIAFGFFEKCFKNFAERASATELLADPFPCEVEPTGNPA